VSAADAGSSATISFSQLKNLCLDLLAWRRLHFSAELTLTAECLVSILRSQLVEAGTLPSKPAVVAAFERQALTAAQEKHAVLLKSAEAIFAVYAHKSFIDKFTQQFGLALVLLLASRVQTHPNSCLWCLVGKGRHKHKRRDQSQVSL
jgi:hypothetical protein